MVSWPSFGALGKNGRGARPLIFSAELARSPSEAGQHPEQLRASHPEVIERALAGTTSGTDIAAEQTPEVASYQRAIAVYGMITVRTDGKKALISTKLEHDGTRGKQWDYHCLEPDDQGVLRQARA